MREARARGIPTMGSGRIFQIPEETIKCQPFECPDHFYVIGGMDFGWDHPQAQVQLWWDKDADTIYVSRVWKAKEKTAVQAWGAVKSWAHKVPTAWPHDGNQHEKGGGEQLKGQYADAGFMMLQEHATWPDGGNAVEPGITELRDMMLDGRFKVFNTCEPFFEEFRLYHRDENGKIVKLNDDVLSAVRYAYMMRRFAKMMRDIKNQKRKRYQPQSGPSHGELKWPTKTDSIPFCVSLTRTGWRAMKPEPRRQMTCILAECRNGMTGYQTTLPCNIADNSMLFARWSGNWSQRCAGTLSTFSSDQKTALILMQPMC